MIGHCFKRSCLCRQYTVGWPIRFWNISVVSMVPPPARLRLCLHKSSRNFQIYSASLLYLTEVKSFSLSCCLCASKSNPGCYTVLYTNSESLSSKTSALGWHYQQSWTYCTFNSPIFTAQMMNRLVWFTHILHSDMHCIFHTVNQTDLVWMLSLRT